MMLIRSVTVKIKVDTEATLPMLVCGKRLRYSYETKRKTDTRPRVDRPQGSLGLAEVDAGVNRGEAEGLKNDCEPLD